MKNQRIIVIGGLNQDLVMHLPRRPTKGETIHGHGFAIYPGGKGNNQAIAAARAGGSVQMLGRVGNDAFSDMLLQTLAENKVDGSLIIRDPDAGAGVAMIFISDDGDNIIAVDPRANGRLSAGDVASARPAIAASAATLLQLEVPMDAILAAASLAKREGSLLILNTAPAPADGVLPGELRRNVDVLIANETEARLMTGIDLADGAGVLEAGRSLFAKAPGLRCAIITLGAIGAAVFENAGEPAFVPTYAVSVRDTTAAGDAFCGAFAAALALGSSFVECARFGCAAGALAATVIGAVPSLPKQAEIAELMRSGKHAAPMR